MSIAKLKYFTASHDEQTFPVTVRLRDNVFCIDALDHLAGVITIDGHGQLKSCNDVFTKYLFGYDKNDLKYKHISMLLPQFDLIMSALKVTPPEPMDKTKHPQTRRVSIQTNTRSSPFPTSPILNTTASLPNVSETFQNRIYRPCISCLHRDGGIIFCDLDLRLLATKFETVYSLWITFERKSICHLDQSHRVPEIETKLVTPDTSMLTTLDVALNDLSPPSETLSSVIPPSGEALSVTATSKLDLESNLSPTEYDISMFEEISFLGKGASSEVKLMRDRVTNQEFVVKIIEKDRILVDTWTQSKDSTPIPLELSILELLKTHSHPNVVQLERYFEDDDHYFVVMRSHGKCIDLFDFIEMHRTGEEIEKQYIFFQICNAISHLHSLDLVHRDIKDENIILNERQHALLIDFGSAAYTRSESNQFNTFCGTIDYCPPEVVLGKPYQGKPQDIWALGILLYVLLYGEVPFFNFDEILSRSIRVPKVISDESVSLLKQMLNKDVKKRINIKQVLDHPWLDPKKFIHLSTL
ncbi:hypothetical protein HMI54_009570 [Coelomomyces lativittatus]|nr:hypothetical protein HMI54_009570 [Coelomomyces lativittatus]KAJ1501972.1 hypothetical protein HMI56_002939 [Coelomomyces lativittatus]KAJ1502052.1 hypothetical protein HMI55_003082 [Coelomomyces lativittatus]